METMYLYVWCSTRSRLEAEEESEADGHEEKILGVVLVLAPFCVSFFSCDAQRKPVGHILNNRFTKTFGKVLTHLFWRHSIT